MRSLMRIPNARADCVRQNGPSQMPSQYTATAGLLANFMAVPFSDAFAARKDVSTGQATIDIVNAGLGKTYSYAEADEKLSLFGINEAHFAKSNDCIVREDLLKSSVSDHPLPVEAFMIPMAWVTFLVTVVFCCTIFRVSFQRFFIKFYSPI